MMNVDLLNLIDTLKEIVKELSIQLDQIQKKNEFQITYKDREKRDPLTSADIFANEFLKRHLKNLLPESGWLSEESIDNSQRMKKEFVWVVDPIDGTRDFAKYQNSYSISIGLLYRNQPILGVVSMPAEKYMVLGLNYHNEAYEPFILKLDFSLKDGKNNIKEEYISHFHYPAIQIQKAKILVSASEYKKKKLQSLPSEWNLHPTGSVARKLAMISIQKGDLLISLTPKSEWDICGGIALILASQQSVSTLEKGVHGFRTISFNKRNLVSQGLVAGNPHLVKEYLHIHETKNIPVWNSYG